MRWQRFFGDRDAGRPKSQPSGTSGVTVGTHKSDSTRSEGRSSRRPQGRTFGVGAQVIIHLNRSEGAWPPQDDPVGIIVAPGEELGVMYWAPPSTQEQSWVVEFEEPFYGLDGSGPHDSARVPEKFLELAPLEH